MTVTTPPRPDLTTWPTAYPRHRGAWTLKGSDGRWGALDPDTGATHTVTPADDPDLPALRASLGAGALVGYRVGRRAVIATGSSYLKVVRPKRLDALVSAHQWFTDFFDEADTPDVMRTDRRGVVELSTVPGTALHQLLRQDAPERELFAAIDEIATTVAALHSMPVPGHLPTRTTDEPGRWLDTITRVDPAAAQMFASVERRLPALPDGEVAVTHGDLHDKNIFHRRGRVGLIDLDGVGLGSAESEIANLAVHLQLRAMQSNQPSSTGGRLAARLHESYQHHRSVDAARLDGAAAHTWFRLACIYHFRASSRRLVPELLRRATDR